MTSPHDSEALRAATVLILAGGASARMGGRPKALLPWGSGSLLEHVVGQASAAAQEVVVVGAQRMPMPAPARGVRDIFVGCGPLGGLHAGLSAARFERCLVVGCDMPFVSARVMRALLDLSAGYDAAVPRASDGLHPLLAVYSRRCLPSVEAQLRDGDQRMVSFLDRVRVRWITEQELRAFDPRFLCLFNINTPQDHERAREIAQGRDESEPSV